MSLLPVTFGLTDALTALLDRFREFSQEDDAPHLLLTVTVALTGLGYDHRAQSLLAGLKPQLSRKGRQSLREAMEDEGGFSLKVEDLGIVGLELEDVVQERILMDEMDDEDDEDLEDEEGFEGETPYDDDDLEGDDFDDLPVESEPQHLTPGRNEQCWCGSGKKYKKCHLQADEEARRA